MILFIQKLYNEKCDSTCKITNEICSIISALGKHWLSVLKWTCTYSEAALLVAAAAPVAAGAVPELLWATILSDWSPCLHPWPPVTVEAAAQSFLVLD